VNWVTWYDAAAFCNWLSDQEGIPEAEWCYQPQKGKDVRDWSAAAYGEGMSLAPDYLRREGYRLPSEAEWEYACRAGAVTSRYYGESEELLGKYAWYTKNSLDRRALPAGSLKPNDFGLFDMLGNALEWCQDSSQSQGFLSPLDVEDAENVNGNQSRILRGGSFLDPPRLVRCAVRNWDEVNYRSSYVGFRPARTFR
jgi:formylglycine-generating enzyme required for sulfatase activity